MLTSTSTHRSPEESTSLCNPYFRATHGLMIIFLSRCLYSGQNGCIYYTYRNVAPLPSTDWDYMTLRHFTEQKHTHGSVLEDKGFRGRKNPLWGSSCTGQSKKETECPFSIRRGRSKMCLMQLPFTNTRIRPLFSAQDTPG